MNMNLSALILYVNVGVVGNSFSIGLSFRQHVSTTQDILDAFRVAIRSEMEKDEVSSRINNRIRAGLPRYETHETGRDMGPGTLPVFGKKIRGSSSS